MSSKSKPAPSAPSMTRQEIAHIEDYAPLNYLTYSMFVVSDRAIPTVFDGMKPVQRRILYTMRELHLNPNASAMKSARVVGQVLGKYHPHGDSSVYDAMVRMSQNFIMRYPLVHGEGNFGSRDGDNAAAYRYTEAKLTPIAEALLDELGADTVDYQPNYDGKEEEPMSLPSRLPFLLLNGASGIAVGMATEFPPHNLKEIGAAARLMIDEPKTDFNTFFDLVPGPDFATGSQIISSRDDLRKVYEEGRGPIRLRARWKVLGGEEVEVKGKRKKQREEWALVFTEIPHGTSTKSIMERIDELMNPQQKEKNGKKVPFSAETLRLKKMFSDLIESVSDSSGKDTGPVYIVITPKDQSIEPESLAQALFAHTDLEKNFPANFTALDEDGNPRQQSPFEWLHQWCRYRIHTVRRRLQDEKNRVDRRLHIIAGRLSILDKIQEVIQMLLASEDPKTDLMEKYGLDEIQADNVLELTLRQIAKLEKIKLEDERAKLLKEQARLAKLLGSDRALRKQVIQELDEDIAKFGDDRRTLIEEASSASAQAVLEQVPVSVSHEPIAIALSERGWLAWKPVKTLEDALVDDYKFKTGDKTSKILFGQRSDELLLLDEQGRGYSLGLHDLSVKADASPLTTWLEPQSTIVDGFLAKPSDRFILAGRQGNGFIIRASEWSSRMKAGKVMLVLEGEDKPLTPIALHHPIEEDKNHELLVLSSDGRAVVFGLDQMKNMPKGKGVTLMGLAQGCHVQDWAMVKPGLSALNEKSKTVEVGAETLDAIRGPRSAGRKGKALIKGQAMSLIHS